MEAFYRFAAVRGIQAEREYYTIMCPLKIIPKIFSFTEVDSPAKLRAQRTLNKARIPQITDYLVKNPHAYIFSAITASIDGDVDFQPEGNKGYKRSVGILTISRNASFIINDGQHRGAAIVRA